MYAALTASSGASVLASVARALASSPILPALSLHQQLTGLPTDQRSAFLSTHFNQLAQARLLARPDLRVQGLWDEGVDLRRLAANHLKVLEARYGRGGHYALDHGVDGTVAKIEDGSLGVWNLVSGNNDAETPLATAGLNLGHGVVEMTRAASVDENGSAVLFARLAQFFASKHANNIWALQTEVRVGAEVTLPSGQKTPGGAPSLHVNLHMGPLLVVSGWIHGYGSAKNIVFDPHFDARLYLQPEAVDLATLHTPETNPCDDSMPSMAEIARATYQQNFGHAPEIISADSQDTRFTQAQIIERKAYHNVWELTGNWTANDLDQFVEKRKADGNIIEIAVQNTAKSIGLQKLLYQCGFIPTGVKPGGRFESASNTFHVDTKLYFQLPNPAAKPFFIPLGLSRDYDGTPIGDVATRLAEVWQRRFKP